MSQGHKTNDQSKVDVAPRAQSPHLSVGSSVGRGLGCCEGFIVGDADGDSLGL